MLISDTTLVYDHFTPGANLAYLDSVLAFSVKNGIDVCIASHPLKWNAAYKEYYNNSYLPVLNTILDKYPAINFYDHTFVHSNSDSLFSDANHLNQKGVNWYNSKLLTKLKFSNTGAQEF